VIRKGRGKDGRRGESLKRRGWGEGGALWKRD